MQIHAFEDIIKKVVRKARKFLYLPSIVQSTVLFDI